MDDTEDVSRPMAPCRNCGIDVHPDTAWGDCDECDGYPGECPSYCSEQCYYAPDATEEIGS